MLAKDAPPHLGGTAGLGINEPPPFRAASTAYRILRFLTIVVDPRLKQKQNDAIKNKFLNPIVLSGLIKRRILPAAYLDQRRIIIGARELLSRPYLLQP